MTQQYDFTREELYELIWAAPLVTLAKRFGISDRGLAKLCDRHKIPRPPQGYWLRLELGKPDEKTPLPPNDDPYLDQISFCPAAKGDVMPPKAMPEHVLREEQLEAALSYKLPKSVDKFHPYIAQYHRRSKEERSTDRYGRISIVRSDTDPGLKVTRNAINRASLFLQGIIDLFATYGWKFKPDHRYKIDRPLAGFWHKDQMITLEIKEIVKQIPYVPKKGEHRLTLYGRQSYDYTPTGQLEVSISNLHCAELKTSWRDSDKTPIEHRLFDIVQACSRGFEYKRLQSIEAERRHQEWLKEEERRKEIARLRRIEEKRKEELFSLSRSFDQVSGIRALIAALEPLDADNPALQGWLTWAVSVADELDPTRKIGDILEKHDAIGNADYYF